MITQQLWQQCLPLTHHSLQAFILNSIDKPLLYNLYQFLKHPQISTITKQVIDLLNLFVYNTYSQFTIQQLSKLSPLKILKLKKLTILTLFQGLKQIPLKTISANIQTTDQQTIDLLIQMSISGDIQVKINQKTSIVQIHYAQLRAKPFSPENTQLLQGKITTILNKNKAILDIIDQTYSEIKNKNEGKRGEGFRSPKTSSGMRRF